MMTPEIVTSESGKFLNIFIQTKILLDAGLSLFGTLSRSV